MNEWQVIVIEGHERDVRAFVAGFLADRKADPTQVVFGDDVGLEPESLGARLRALLRGGHHAVLAPPEPASALATRSRVVATRSACAWPIDIRSPAPPSPS